MSPTWHLRLFQTGNGRCEDRKYDQHFILKCGSDGRLTGTMVDDIRMPLSEWTMRHNRWADGEVAELESKETAGRLQPDMRGNPAQRKRFLRQKYDQLPLFIRPFALFAYRYFFRLGFLDGTEGSFSGSCKPSGSAFLWTPKSGRNARHPVWLEIRHKPAS